jgi:hypothetical protein
MEALRDMRMHPATLKPKMPSRRSNEAPLFSGKARHLNEYLDEVELICRARGIGREDFAYCATFYAPEEELTLWRACEATAGRAWDAFKAAICLKYPGSDGTRVYTIRDLDDVVHKLGEYAREFEVISDYLISCSQLSVREESMRLLGGLPQAIRDATLQRLITIYPLRAPEDGYDRGSSERRRPHAGISHAPSHSASRSACPDNSNGGGQLHSRNRKLPLHWRKRRSKTRDALLLLRPGRPPHRSVQHRTAIHLRREVRAGG